MELTNKERAELTYRALQKRKINKRKRLEYEINNACIKLMFRCQRLKHN